MKKSLIFGMTVIVVLLSVFLLVGCGENSPDDIENIKPNGIVSVVKTGSEGLTDTYTITFSGGTTTTFSINNGDDGHSLVVEIGENGNLFLDDVDTEVKAQGTDGEPGLSAYELYLKYHPEYEGTEEEWVNGFSEMRTT